MLFFFKDNRSNLFLYFHFLVVHFEKSNRKNQSPLLINSNDDNNNENILILLLLLFKCFVLLLNLMSSVRA